MHSTRARNMSQQIRAHRALAMDLSSFPSTDFWWFTTTGNSTASGLHENLRSQHGQGVTGFVHSLRRMGSLSSLSL